jgi:hypothetical protein
MFMNTFETRMGFTTLEWSALLGAHTLGRMERNNSGFEGPWVSVRAEQNVFNNRYYRELISNNWARFTQTNNLKLWKIPTTNTGTIPSTNPIRMLDTDAGMFWRISDGQCQITRVTNSCPEEPRRTNSGSNLPTIIRSYAANNAAWLGNFSAGWSKLTNFGGETLFLVTSCGNGSCEGTTGGETKANCPADCK